MAQMDESQPSGGARNYNVGVLGATGAVGQRFVELLAVHPWFQLTCLGASSKSTGVAYDAAVRWRLPSPIPNDAAKLPVLECLVENFSGKCDIIFSALDAAVAGPIESSFARSGFAVFSNAKSHRYYPQVPILIPTVNPEHLSAIEGQASFMDSRGFIVTNANCSATGLCIALAVSARAGGSGPPRRARVAGSPRALPADCLLVPPWTSDAHGGTFGAARAAGRASTAQASQREGGKLFATPQAGGSMTSSGDYCLPTPAEQYYTIRAA
eukprot:GHVT01091148.1.p1 GENE.GHVT01091148.1~~GHVT01091148.1.p1  ORF type:complete len:269 (-),score=46.59 GHVT01091148.1:864-1670(-)